MGLGWGGGYCARPVCTLPTQILQRESACPRSSSPPIASPDRLGQTLTAQVDPGTYDILCSPSADQTSYHTSFSARAAADLHVDARNYLPFHTPRHTTSSAATSSDGLVEARVNLPTNPHLHHSPDEATARISDFI